MYEFLRQSSLTHRRGEVPGYRMTAEFHIEQDWQSETLWLADRHMRIARIAPPRLLDVRLSPRLAPQIRWLTLFWWQYPDHAAGSRSVWVPHELHLNDDDPQRFMLLLKTHNQDRSVESQCEVVVTFDSQRDSYLYTIHTVLTVHEGRRWLVEPQDGVEYANPWLVDVAAPASDTTSKRAQRWPWILYRDGTGRIVRLALNHLGGPHHWQIGFGADDAWLGFFSHPDGNPVIALDPATARRTRAEICAWGHDVHFLHRLDASQPFVPDPNRLDAPAHRQLLVGSHQLEARYQVYSLPRTEGEALLAASVPAAIPEEMVQRLIRPAYRIGNNSFAEGLHPSIPDPSWYWEPSVIDGLFWDRTEGHGDANSLCIVNVGERSAFWEAALGPDFWQAPLQPKRTHRLSGWLHTEDVSGAGAYLRFQFSSYRRRTGQAPELPAFHSIYLTGDQGWRYVEITIPAHHDDDITRGYIRLCLDGSGRAWFDDVELRSLDHEPG